MTSGLAATILVLAYLAGRLLYWTYAKLRRR
jgi:hypothetical protein